MKHARSAKKGERESPSRIEPAFIEGEIPERIADRAGEVLAAGAAFGASLHPKTAASLAQLVRIMNAYYSNLIEGHNTRPVDIVRALEGRFERDEDRRNLQVEAAAHVRVQRYIDDIVAAEALPEPASASFIRNLHRRFYVDASKTMLTMKNGATYYAMVPGDFRSEPLHDVIVGRHQPPSSDNVEAFMAYFADRYRFHERGKMMRVVMAAAAHHRFNYIHPFSDGNGRVSRLMSHAMLQAAGIGAHGLWSISRGLARGLGDRDEYKRLLDAADAPRDGDVDGRGNLSQRALVAWTEWFLVVCLDQIRFMSSLFELNRLSERIRAYAVDIAGLDDAAARLLEEAVRGDIPRGEIARITGQPERTARRTLNRLVESGLLASDTPKGPVSLRFTLELARSVFPQIFEPTGAEAAGFR
jgi:Fic family protein